MTQSIPGSAARTVSETSTQTSEVQDLANTEDLLLAKLLEASGYERSGETERAVSLYREIVAEDAEGAWGQSAQKALEGLGESVTAPVEERIETGPVGGTELPSISMNRAHDAGHHENGRVSEVQLVAAEIAPSAVEPADLEREEDEQRASRISAAGGSVASFRWAAVGAAVIPVAVLSAAVLWWVPNRFEERFQSFSVGTPVDSSIVRQEVEALVLQQRLLGGMVGVGAVVLGALSASWTARVLHQRLRQVSKPTKRAALLGPVIK